MSVTVRHLNGDSTFLLIFSPETEPQPCDLRSANGAYSVLIDPWLVGSSVNTATWFAVTHRLQPSCIAHLSELDDEPNVVICSQNKQDHTNKGTLLQLRPESKTIIVAEPAAAREIKSWRHFDPNRVCTMSRYDPKAKFGNTLRLYIPPLSANGDAGEVNISFIPAKNYMTGLHNAFGITYRPPTRTKSWAPVPTMDLPRTKLFHLPMSPPLQASGIRPKSACALPISSPTKSCDRRAASETKYHNSYRPHFFKSSHAASPEPLTSPRLDLPYDNALETFFTGPHALPTPPASPPAADSEAKEETTGFLSGASALSLASSVVSTSERPSSESKSARTTHAARPKALSVLYSPHGMQLSELKPYIQNHLVALPGALPLNLLLHSFDSVENPWWLGGNIMSGAASGMEIARALMAKCWISAHDEIKDNRGLATKLMRIKQAAMEEIKQALVTGQSDRSRAWICDVRCLDSGEQLVLSNKPGSVSAGLDTTSDAAGKAEPVPLINYVACTG